MKPDELFRYCSKYATRAEKAGNGTQWPSIRQIKRRFRGANYQAVEDACANYTGGGYLGIGVGVQVSGPGGGWHYDKNLNDHVVEAYL